MQGAWNSDQGRAVVALTVALDPDGPSATSGRKWTPFELRQIEAEVRAFVDNELRNIDGGFTVDFEEEGGDPKGSVVFDAFTVTSATSERAAPTRMRDGKAFEPGEVDAIERHARVDHSGADVFNIWLEVEAAYHENTEGEDYQPASEPIKLAACRTSGELRRALEMIERLVDGNDYAPDIARAKGGA
jgi:hypothetical protein